MNIITGLILNTGTGFASFRLDFSSGQNIKQANFFGYRGVNSTGQPTTNANTAWLGFTATQGISDQNEILATQNFPMKVVQGAEYKFEIPNGKTINTTGLRVLLNSGDGCYFMW